ncbi:MAG: 2-C-methyl-D-erythritol 4-phosphate cytidylyltransferase [Clostridiales bacterium]|nr:2-C-methyl-D-erythritol 4-phosphate cytidylyltransferase [Clostridiales bacterium]
MRIAVIIVAAGDSRRMGSAANKALLTVAGKPVLRYVLDMWQDIATEILVAARLDDWSAINDIAASYGGAIRLVAGGKHRAASVMQALATFDNNALPDLIAVHDAARPLTKKRDIIKVIEAAKHKGAAILAAPIVNTIRYRVGDSCGAFLPRDELLAAQTPQIFLAKRLMAAYAAADETTLAKATDDAALVISAGYPCAYVWASSSNLKLTYPEDLLVAEAILRREN